MNRYKNLLSIIIWGSLWGIFEATVGYFLHLVSFGYSFLVWFPAAIFFMTAVYSKTKKVHSIIYVGLLCAAIKLLNLLLPIRIDMVINPAISIVFEALALAGVVYAVKRISFRSIAFKGVVVLALNTLWRVLFILYVAFLVPAWMREISVISQIDKLIKFIITQNLLTSGVIFIGYLFKPYIFAPVELTDKKISASFGKIPVLQPIIASLLLFANILLGLVLL